LYCNACCVATSRLEKHLHHLNPLLWEATNMQELVRATELLHHARIKIKKSLNPVDMCVVVNVFAVFHFVAQSVMIFSAWAEVKWYVLSFALCCFKLILFSTTQPNLTSGIYSDILGTDWMTTPWNTFTPDWKTWQLSTRYRACQGDFQAWHAWKNFGAWNSRLTAFHWNHNGAWNLFPKIFYK